VISPLTMANRSILMNRKLFIISGALAWLTLTLTAADAPKEHIFTDQPLGVQVSIKMVGPYMQAADLQIICLFKHKDSGDVYEGAAAETDKHLSGLLSALRNRGEFVGELGETLLFAPPKGSIPAKRFMLIGLGDEAALSVDSLKVVGRVAAREAVRLQAAHVAWAPVIRDQGNSVIPVGEGDRVFVSEWLSAYDTELKLQAQKLAPKFAVKRLVIEAGPAFFDDAVKQVGAGLLTVSGDLVKRDKTPYLNAGK
jgi:hypothetical protein